MRPVSVSLAAVLGLVVLVPHTTAQSLPISLFERYLDSLRQQAGIPGLSAAIVQDRRVVWDRGYGYKEVDGFVAATADTPYPLLDLSQTVAATLLLQQCVDQGHLELADAVRRWVSNYDGSATVAQLLSHATTAGDFEYSTSRYASLTDVIAQCASRLYPTLVAEKLLDRLGMTNSVPGHDLANGSPNRSLFSSGALDRYTGVLRQVAAPYKVDSQRRPSRGSYSSPSLSASTGIVSTVGDLARFDAALDDGILLRADTRERAWRASGSTPTGLGWFVQNHNGERIVWHFGLARDAYSAMYIKVPGRNVSLILLANSDGLAAPYNLSQGDVTVSLFAQLFLKLFVS